MKKCEHGLTTSVCYVCASAKYGDQNINRWEAEIEGWRQRYEALLKTLADNEYLAKPMMLADKQSYELGFFHGAAAEREACAQVCENIDNYDENVDSYYSDVYAAAIRARGEE